VKVGTLILNLTGKRIIRIVISAYNFLLNIQALLIRRLQYQTYLKAVCIMHFTSTWMAPCPKYKALQMILSLYYITRLLTG